MECFEKTLNYTSPGHGGWGIVRVAALVPEGHLLFVCPSACFRHGALGAIQHGYKNKASYLYLTPAEVIQGYDDVIIEGVAELIKRKKSSLKVIFVFVACIDDFIGTDVEAICKQLSKKYSDITFCASHMNPIASDTKRPPLVTTYNAMMSALKIPEVKTDTANLLGNFVSIPKECELFDVLRHYGINEMKQLEDYKTYDGFSKMAESKINLVLSPIAVFTSDNLDQRLGTKSIKAYVSYDMDEVKKAYDTIYDQLNATSKYDLTEVEIQTNKEIELTLKELNNREIIVSEGAVLRPFSLAYSLLKSGFNVTEVVSQQVIPVDKEAFDNIMEQYPKVEIKQPQHYRAVYRETSRNEKLAIGFEGAYLENCEHVVNLNGDEGMYGYMGIRTLMQMMRKANVEKVDLRKLIEVYGAVV